MSNEHEVELDDIIYFIVAEHSVTFDANACCDSDGNRGRPEYYPELETFSAYSEGGNEITDKDLLKRLEEKYIGSHEEQSDIDKIIGQYNEAPCKEPSYYDDEF